MKHPIPMTPNPGPLPYTDTKPVGAADFYFAINATFRFVLGSFGMEGLRRYWTDLGTQYYAPVVGALETRAACRRSRNTGARSSRPSRARKSK